MAGRKLKNALLPILLLTSAISFVLPAHLSHAACTEKVRVFLEEWRRVHPEEGMDVAKSVESADARLADFNRGGVGPSYEGAEGKIHTSPLSPDRALKVWFPHRMPDFRDAVDFLVATRKAVERIPEMASKLRVVQVFERGDGWIVREFLPESRPLADVLETNAEAKQALQDLRALANKNQGKGPMFQRLQRMLGTNPPSVNLHWDPATRQVVMIDGF